MTDDVESRRRRSTYRATHRGNKEMDWLLGRFALARLAAMSPESLTAFERLLLVPDPHLYNMIMHPEVAPPGEHAVLVAELRVFHGLAGGLDGVRPGGSDPRAQPLEYGVRPAGSDPRQRHGTE